MKHLPEPRCPECGRAFDPDDPSTFLTAQRRPRWLVFLIIAGAVYVVTFSVSLVELFTYPWMHVPPSGNLPTISGVNSVPRHIARAAGLGLTRWPGAFILVLGLYIVLSFVVNQIVFVHRWHRSAKSK